MAAIPHVGGDLAVKPSSPGADTEIDP